MLGWRSSCQGDPRAHGTSPDQSDARSEDTCSNSACPPSRQREAGRAHLCFPSSGTFEHHPLPLCGTWSGWEGPVTWGRTQHLSPLKGTLSFSMFSGSRELSPFPQPNFTDPGSPVPSLAAGRSFNSFPTTREVPEQENSCQQLRAMTRDAPEDQHGAACISGSKELPDAPHKERWPQPLPQPSPGSRGGRRSSCQRQLVLLSVC